MIILILADALRADHLSCYNGKVQTPNIDSLAKHGILWENYFANSNATEPCITTMLTGHYPHKHGILKQPRCSTFQEVGKQKIDPLIEEHHLCNILRANGYYTVLIDSLSFFNKPYFDEFRQVQENMLYPEKPKETVETAKEVLQENTSKTFVFIHFWNTHHPYFPSYPGEVAKLDSAVGELLKIIKPEDTVIFTADHGESIGEHVTEARKTDPGHHHLYDEIIHIPLIIRDPILEVNSRIPFMREEIDFAPSLLELKSISFKKEWFSPNFQHLIQSVDKECIYLEEHTYQEQIGLRTRNYKFMEKTGANMMCPLCGTIHGASRYELYDLELDPEEKHNVALPGGALWEKCNLVEPQSNPRILVNFSKQVWTWYSK